MEHALLHLVHGLFAQLAKYNGMPPNVVYTWNLLKRVHEAVVPCKAAFVVTIKHKYKPTITIREMYVEARLYIEIASNEEDDII